MNRKEAAELSPIIKAFSEGKIIQTSIKGKPWEDLGEDIAFYTNDKYRIKPEPKYRPFRNAEECWEEMKKHQPFGWLKRIGDNQYCLLTDVSGEVECEGVRIDGDGYFWDTANYEYTFVDGTPFGIKEGE